MTQPVETRIYIDSSGAYYSSATGPRSPTDSYLPNPSQATLDILGLNSIPVPVQSFNEAMFIVMSSGHSISSSDQVSQLPTSPVSPVEG